MADILALNPGVLVETALTFAPWLLEIPVLGRILLLFAPGGGNDFRAQEEYQRILQARETERKTRIKRQARYVIKASDAMQCVEDNIMKGAFLLALGKGLLNLLISRGGGNSPDILVDRIFTCIEAKTLKQTGRRRKKTGTYYGRPARGHGRGRRVPKPER